MIFALVLAAPLQQPPVIRGDATLEVTTGRVVTDDFSFTGRSYNGGAPGPTLVVRAGEDFTVTLDNTLEPGDVNVSALHLHGLHADPLIETHADGKPRKVEPGASLDYSYALRADHPAGTHWYHPHVYESAAVQQSDGMAGAVIVEDVDPPAALAAMTDVVLVLQHFAILDMPAAPKDSLFLGIQSTVLTGTEDSGLLAIEKGSTLDRAAEGTGDAWLVNGQQKPTASLRPGEWQRWRLIDAAPASNLQLTLPGCEMRLLATDGIYLIGGAPRPVEMVAMTSGSRRDVAVMCSEAGTYNLTTVGGPEQQTLAYPGGTALIELSVAGEPMAMDEPTELPPLPAWMPDLRGPGVVAARPFVMDMQGAIGFEFAPNDAPWLSLAFGALVLYLAWWCHCFDRRGGADDALLPDGLPLSTGSKKAGPPPARRRPCCPCCTCVGCLTFTPLVIFVFLTVVNCGANFEVAYVNGLKAPTLHSMKLGEVEEWTIVGSKMGPPSHPMHLHVHHFQIVKHDVANTYGFDANTGDFLDVGVSPEPEFGGGNYTIRFVPHHFTGLVAAHCHLFVHVAPGMIMYAPVSE